MRCRTSVFLNNKKSLHCLRSALREPQTWCQGAVCLNLNIILHLESESCCQSARDLFPHNCLILPFLQLTGSCRLLIDNLTLPSVERSKDVTLSVCHRPHWWFIFTASCPPALPPALPPPLASPCANIWQVVKVRKANSTECLRCNLKTNLGEDLSVRVHGKGVHCLQSPPPSYFS